MDRPQRGCVYRPKVTFLIRLFTTSRTVLWTLPLRLLEVMMVRKQCELDARGRACLVEHVTEVVLNGVFADPKPLGDLTIRTARRNKAHDLQLAAGEAEGAGGPSG